MSHESKLWIVELDKGIAEAEFPPLGETLTVLAADVSWVLVEADTMGDVERACDGYRFHVVGHPRAGKYVDLGGDVVYVGDAGYKAKDAVEVLRSLDVEIDEYAEIYADDILSNMQRVF